VNGALSACDGMKGLPEDKLEVKYPRKGGVRPSPDDNPYNAWLVSPLQAYYIHIYGTSTYIPLINV